MNRGAIMRIGSEPSKSCEMEVLGGLSCEKRGNSGRSNDAGDGSYPGQRFHDFVFPKQRQEFTEKGAQSQVTRTAMSEITGGGFLIATIGKGFRPLRFVHPLKEHVAECSVLAVEVDGVFAEQLQLVLFGQILDGHLSATFATLYLFEPRDNKLIKMRIKIVQVTEVVSHSELQSVKVL